MTSSRSVHVFEDRTALIDEIADRFIRQLTHTLTSTSFAHVVLTGGTVGIDVLAAIGEPRRAREVDWHKVHFWWGDERWLPAGDADRNDTQAFEALLSRIDCPSAQVHSFPAADGEFDVDAAAREYSRELESHGRSGTPYPHFDILFLGVGPDAHIASLFPGLEGILERSKTVVAVRNSPKPPPERLSLTLPVINSADRVWLCLSGADKAGALGLALAGANVAEVPASGATGRSETRFFVDRAAAGEVPQELLSEA